MSILEYLFDGAIQPSGRRYFEPEIVEKNKQVSEIKQKFADGLTDAQKDFFDDVCTEINLLGSLYQKESFKDGFKLAIQLMKEADGIESVLHLIDKELYE